jgi:Na+-driven multidrug efflux pump
LQSLISRRAGENKPGEIGKLFNQGILITILIATAGIILTYTVTPLLFHNILHEQQKAGMAVSFLQIRIWGLPFLYIYQMRNALLVGTNQSKYLVMGTIAEAFANVFFDYTFIFGKLGFPEMGFNGAAVASILAEFTGMFVIYIVIHQKGIAKRFSIFKNIRWDKHNAALITNMSAPLVFQHGISIATWEFFFILIERNQPSDTPQAISNVMRNVFGIFGCVSWAFASTCNSMVSNVIGQGKKDEVIHVIRKIVTLSTGIAVCFCIVLNLIPGIFLSVFGQGKDFIEQGLPVVRVISFAMVLMSFSIIWLFSVTGTGNTRVTFLIELFTITLYNIFVYVVLEKLKLSITIGWMSEWLYWICMFIPSFFYIRSNRWRKKVI